MSLRFHEIAETKHTILNPFSDHKLMLVGQACDLREKMRVLDLACGKGETLIRWAQAFNITGVGVDISPVFLEAARARAYELDVVSQVNWIEGDAADYPQDYHEFDVVCCLGATWIGGALTGTLDLMRTALKPQGGVLVVGEPYWHDDPPAWVLEAQGYEPGLFTTLEGTLDRFETANFALVEMVLSSLDDWDRYEASQWKAVHDYLAHNPDDPQAAELREWFARRRRAYLTSGRRYLGWGVFVLRVDENIPPARSDPRQSADQPVFAEVRGGMIWVTLADGRVIANPVAWYDWLASAPPDDQTLIDLEPLSLYWPSLDKRVDVRSMLRPRR